MLVPLLLLALVELALRLCGFGDSTDFFVPVDDGRMLTTNPKFAWQFYPRATATSPTPLLLAKEKAPGTKRVFVLGESAAAGTPDPAFSFSRLLELMLADQFPTQRVEVINTAMRGIDSHIVRHIARECAALSPDAFIIYMGNNDMIGLHSPTPGAFTLSDDVRWLRLQHAVKRTRLAQAGESLLAGIAKENPRAKQDMDFLRRQRLAFDDPQRAPVYRHFERNLRDICEMAETARARAIVCSVAVNLRDFPPLASLHRRDLTADQLAEWERFYAEGSVAERAGNFVAALAQFQRAAEIDAHYAELLFRIARCHERLGNHEDARTFFARARDWDALQFRTDGRLNAIARQVARDSTNIVFADIEKAFSESAFAENRLPGGKLFSEHVHFTFAGDHELASALAPKVAEALKLPPPSRPWLSREACAAALAFTPIDEMNVKAAIARMTAGPPFLDQLEHGERQRAADAEVQARLNATTQREFEAALAVYRAALAARPDDCMLRFNLANLFTQFNQHTRAAEELAEVVKRMPHHRMFRVAYGSALLQAGKAREAANEFEAALESDRTFKPALDGLMAAQARAR